jgi:signal transduction histidine kinase
MSHAQDAPSGDGQSGDKSPEGLELASLDNVRRLLDALPVPAFLTTSDGRILMVSQPLACRIGIDVDALCGQPCSVAVHARCEPDEGCPMPTAQATGLQVSRVTIDPRTGAKTLCTVCDTSMRTAAGDPVLLHLPEFGVMRDDGWADELRQVDWKARVKRDPLARLVAAAAHDLNNVITAMRWHASKLAACQGDVTCSSAGASIARACEVAHAICRDLLDLNGSYASQEVTRVDEVLADVVRLVRPVLEEDIDISVRIPPRSDPVKVSRDGLFRAIVNIILNAREAMPGGGRLYITLSRTPKDQSSLLLGMKPADRRPFVSIEFRDTGRGMSKEALAQAFESSYSTKAGHAGLGLALVRQIMQEAGGHLRAESVPDVGSTFTLFFPAAKVVA